MKRVTFKFLMLALSVLDVINASLTNFYLRKCSNKENTCNEMTRRT